jgi:asparagine synthase (glutamine-hydrolysing)
MLDAELGAAVEDSLLGDPPLATFCSGGLDSSLIMAMARRKHRAMPALVATLEDGDWVDEVPYAQLVARRLGVELEIVRITADGWRQAFVDAVRHHQGPLPNPTPVALSQLAAAARRRGVKAVLVGDGADTLFGANWGRHREAFRRVLPRSALYRRRAAALRHLGPRGARAELARRARGHPMPRAAQVSFGGETTAEDNATVRAVDAYGGSGPRAELEGGLLADLSLTMPHLLNRWDANGMQHGVEVRLPFLGQGVVSLALNLPLEARVMPRQKGLLADVAATHIPKAVLRRPKVGGMLLGSDRWITEAARPEFLRDGMLRDVLELDADHWRRCVDAATGLQGFTLWSAEVWSRLVVAGGSSSAVEAELWLS